MQNKNKKALEKTSAFFVHKNQEKADICTISNNCGACDLSRNHSKCSYRRRWDYLSSKRYQEYDNE